MKSKVLLPIIAAVIVLGGGVFYFLNSNKDTESSEFTQTNSTSQTSSSADSEKQADVDATEKLPKQTVGSTTDCSLYTYDELKKIWGVTFTDMDDTQVKSTSDGGQLYTCDYNETDSGMGLSVVMEYRAYKSEDAAKQDMKNVRDGAKIGEEVYFVQDEQSGVGDEAFFSLPKKQVGNPKNPNEQLYVRKGNLVMLISAVNLDGVKSTYRDGILQTYKLHL